MVDIVQVGLSVDSREVDKGTKSLNEFGKQGEKTQKATDRMSASFKGMGSAIAALGLGALLTDMFKTAASFESMAMSLEVVTGSAQKATQAMEGITEFAKNTPFQVSEITDAFIKLKALGIDPTEEKLRSFGNTSSAMGKSLNQMIEAVADAATGEFERLKEFGIKASSEGDRVKLTFQGVTTEVGKNSKEITQYLEDIGRTKFAGAMEKQMGTINGKLSNLGDSVDQLAVKLFQDNQGGKGILDVAIVSVEWLMDGIDSMREGIVQTIGGFEKFFTYVKFGAKELQQSVAVLWRSREENIRAAKLIEEQKQAELKAIDETVAAYIKGEEKKQTATGSINAAGASNPVDAKQIELDKIREAETDAMFAEIDRKDAFLEWELEHNAKKEAARQEHLDRLYNMEAGSQQASLDFAKSIRDNDLKSAVSNGSLMLANAAKQSKTMFEIQKAFSLAKAVAALPSAVMDSFNNGGGYPWGLIPAGLMLATGLQQINAIRSATFGGGASTPSVSGGGSTAPSAPVASGLPPGSTATPEGTEQPTVREMRVTVEGDGPHSEGMRKFAENLAETIKDMGGVQSLVVS